MGGTSCRPICGDGQLEDNETCDDGNTADGDGCSHHCLTEPSWSCTGGDCARVAMVDGGQRDGGPSYLFCGDGIVSGGEECDVAPADYEYRFIGEDGQCTSQCRWGAHCGDGELDVEHEECDLGPDNGVRDSEGKGCSIGCTKLHYCGDGIIDTDRGEQCDLGALNALGSYCTPDCTIWLY